MIRAILEMIRAILDFSIEIDNDILEEMEDESERD